MKYKALDKLQILKSKYSGYQSLFDYNLRNLCVKAEPASFLPIKVFTDFGLENLEEVAMIALDPDDEFAVICYVKEQRNFMEVQNGILRSHPEFKQKAMRLNDNSEAKLPDDIQEGRELYLRITMPLVDDDRYDLMNKTLDMLYQKTRSNVENANATEGTQIINLCQGEVETLDIVKPEMETHYNNTIDAINKMRDNKREEIEEGHQRWLRENQDQKNADPAQADFAQSLSME